MSADPYWLIAFEQTYRQGQSNGLDTLKRKVGRLASIVNFQIPGNLKIGTLDQLMSITERLAKVDTMIKSVLNRLHRTLNDLIASENKGEGGESKGSDRKKTQLHMTGKTTAKYLETFRWDIVKYKPTAPLKLITDGISETVKKADENIRKLSHMYNEVVSTLEGIVRTDNGSLLVRPLGPIIGKNVVSPTNSLEWVFVVVPAKKRAEFLSSYETMERAYKKRRERKLREEAEDRMQRVQSRLIDEIPQYVADAADEKKRASLLQGDNYKVIAGLIRDAKQWLDASSKGDKAANAGPGDSGPAKEGSRAAEIQRRVNAQLASLPRDVEELRKLLSEAVDAKLQPYESQTPNTTGAKQAVLMAIATAEEFGIDSAMVEMCKKLVPKAYEKWQRDQEKKQKAQAKAGSGDSKKSGGGYVKDPQYVVPRSAVEIKVDAKDGERRDSAKKEEEFCLFKFLVLKKFRDPVFEICRSRRYTVRHYTFNEESELRHYKLKVKLMNEKKKFRLKLHQKILAEFPEAFSAWIHIKAIRCFAESILRFGLPVRPEDYKAVFPRHVQAALLQPQRGRDGELRRTLNALYQKKGEEELLKELKAGETDFSGFGSDFYPYVYQYIELDHSS